MSRKERSKGRTPEEVKCDGCGKTRIVPEYGTTWEHPDSPAARMKVGVGELEVWVCGKYSDYHYSHRPRRPCERKVFEKHSLCPGCDREYVTPGKLCDDCDSLLEDGRRSRDEDPLQWAELKYYAIVGRAFDDESHMDREERKALCIALAQVAAGRGASVELSYPKVELTASQHEALAEFMPLLRKCLDGARRAGHQQGRSMLTALARGEMTVNDLNAVQATVDEEEDDDDG